MSTIGHFDFGVNGTCLISHAMLCLHSRNGHTIYFLQMFHVYNLLLMFIYFEHYYVSLQYLQVCFISTLTIILDSFQLSVWKRYAWLCFGIAVALFWSFIVLWTGHLYVDYHPLDYTLSSIVACCFVGSMLYTSHTIVNVTLLTQTNVTKHIVEIDLLLYLTSLNAICFFSQDTFNANLHMILDLRTFVMLFNGLYQPKDKVLLLKSKAFMSIIALVILAYLVDGVPWFVCHVISNIMYIVIGSILFYESNRVHKKFI